jgi:copper chaperone CopZ
VKADSSTHTVTVRFEDTVADLETITKALNDVGYTVGEAKELID